MSTAPDSCAISLGELRDIDDVIEVMNAAFDPVFGEAWSKSQLSGLLITPGSWLLLLHIADKTAGFAIARSVLDESELMLLAIAPDFRSRGFGRQLLDAVIHEAKEREARRLFLEMRSDNDAALRLYGKSGFIPVGHRLRYYRGEDGILLLGRHAIMGHQVALQHLQLLTVFKADDIIRLDRRTNGKDLFRWAIACDIIVVKTGF